ncbi:serine/threonine protein kinase [Paenibacillus swuensis]|uniref:Serine/threonine protein kinase n=1 Tax=Paenibacillus swuensis TaxID=1178515 RepID=A0A172TI47_9BACL|nr:serine/threonine-protein kinase [Paenibacillus swuensis]ANE46636.1 serine/threonine protein kinase [Paenibacillus swuensis]
MEFITDELIESVERELLPLLKVESIHPHEPVIIKFHPEGWEVLGTGNYAAVIAHRDNPEMVIKVYAEGRPGLADEVEVYRRLGNHPAFSTCYHSSDSYLIMKRMRGITLYNCVIKGIRIPRQAIQDIDEALYYARSRGLCPHDIHGKNVMLYEGRGKVLDVSDFLKEEYCRMWDDLKKGYDKYYEPFLHRFPMPIPGFMMDWVRRGYRLYKKRD